MPAPGTAKTPGLPDAAFQRLRSSHGAFPADGWRTELEQAFGASLGSVRIHDDAASHEAAADAGAAAFVHGDDVYLADAPPVGSFARRRLLAHELAHVLQQRRTGTATSSAAGDGQRFERDADAAARRVLRGDAAALPPAPRSAPAVQFQFRHAAAGRPEVEQAVREFLEAALAAQGGTRLRLDDAVLNALRTLARAPRPGGSGTDPGAVMRMDLLLADPALVPRDPRPLARRVAAILPSPFDRAALARLMQTAVAHAAPSVGLGDVVARTETPELLPPPVPDAAESAEHMVDIGYAMTGRERPTTFGPYQVPLLRVGRIVQGLGEVAERSDLPRRPPPATLPASVQRAVDATRADELTPSAVDRGRRDAYPDARLIAADLARRLELGRRAGQPMVELRLPERFGRLAKQDAVRQQVEAFVLRIVAAFPAPGPLTPSVDIFFGDRWAARVH